MKKNCTDVRLKIPNKNKPHRNKYYQKKNITVTQNVFRLHVRKNSRNAKHIKRERGHPQHI